MEHPQIAQLRFHDALFKYLGIQPIFSTTNRQVIAEQEAECGVSFPASVKELFSIRGFVYLIDKFDEGPADNVSQLHCKDDHGGLLGWLGDPKTASQGYLGVCTDCLLIPSYYVRLDEGDDPPVYSHAIDVWYDDLSAIPWDRVAPSFSEFVLQLIVESVYIVGSGYDGNEEE